MNGGGAVASMPRTVPRERLVDVPRQVVSG
jgi:hypothetical protein